MFNLRSIKTQLILYLLAFALFLVFKGRDFSFLLSFLTCVAAAVFAEAGVLYFKARKLQVTESALIAGAIMGCVFSSDEVWWKLAIAAVLAILFKHAVRSRNKHIFNPAALGIFLSAVLGGVALQWNGTYLWYFLVPFGIYLAHKMRKLEIVAGYAGMALVLFGTQALLQKVPLLNIFGYFSYFYVFIMVIEPKTTPSNRVGKYVFGAAVAGLIFILTESGARFDVELFSLLAMNAAVPLMNKFPVKQGGPV
jgi:Na+-translocating ferredoxin:NAD+ oxidoreductase RnfD subunit